MQGLRASHPDRAVTFEMNAASTVVANKRLLAIALTCLLGNAWKFTAKKPEGWIRVTMFPGEALGDLVLKASDNGKGFDTDYSDKLFMSFQRLHSAADCPGNGLGLVTVKRLGIA